MRRNYPDLPMKHLAMKSLFSFQPSGLSFSACRKWVMASGRLAEGGEANSVAAIFLSIHDNCNVNVKSQTSQAQVMPASASYQVLHNKHTQMLISRNKCVYERLLTEDIILSLVLCVTVQCCSVEVLLFTGARTWTEENNNNIMRVTNTTNTNT